MPESLLTRTWMSSGADGQRRPGRGGRRGGRGGARRHLRAGQRLVRADRLPDGVGARGPLDAVRVGGVGLGRELHEADLVGADLLHALRDVLHLTDVQALVGRHRRGGGVEEAEQLVRPQQQGGLRRLLDHRGQERLLTVDPTQVGPVTDVVAQPYVGQRVLAVDLGLARWQVQEALAVLDGLGEADRHAAEGVDHALEAAEVDHDEVVDEDAREALEGADRAGRPAQGEVLVPLADDAVRRPCRSCSCSRAAPSSSSHVGSTRRSPTCGRRRGARSGWCRSGCPPCRTPSGPCRGSCPHGCPNPSRRC